MRLPHLVSSHCRYDVFYFISWSHIVVANLFSHKYLRPTQLDVYHRTILSLVHLQCILVHLQYALIVHLLHNLIMHLLYNLNWASETSL